MDYLPSALRPHGRERVRHAEDGLSGSTLQFPPGSQPVQIPQQSSTILDPENKLSMFRHLVGIHSTKEFSAQRMDDKGNFITNLHHNHFNFEGRAAPNMGIYNRVCHREAAAKRGYKIASVLINSCLGIQVVVAAALTAMGAANSNHVGITAFGAINTVIAGLLTYLKGSGLPNRIRWYENEWKKVREYIEQRERDFSRPGCQLDVNQVVQAVEIMYEQVKLDVQNNTPENYVSISDVRARSAAAVNPQIPNLNDLANNSAHQGKNKLEELELKYGHKVADFLGSLAHKEEERLKKLEGDIDASKHKALAALDDEKDKISRSALNFERDMEAKGALMAEKELEHARTGFLNRGLGLAKDLETAKSGFLSRGESFAKGLDAAKSAALHKGDDFTHNLHATKAAALQRGRDYEADVHAKAAAAEAEVAASRDAALRVGENVQHGVEARAAQLAVAEQALEQEAQRTREAAQRVGESVQAVGQDVARAGESVQRVGRAVEEEMHMAPGRRKE